MIYSQSNFNGSPVKRIINESLYSGITLGETKQGLFFSYNYSFYLNTNLPNLENINGKYLPRGYGSFNSSLFIFNHKYGSITSEPTIYYKKKYEISIPKKENEFSVLNDIPNNYNQEIILKNTGFKLQYYGITTGFGNWNQWWGPGIHNSLSLSNNASGFYHYFIKMDAKEIFDNNMDVFFKYLVSKPMKNLNGDKYFLSSLFFKIKYKILELGYNRNIISGGHQDLNWSQKDAFSVLINQNKIKYWDTINTYYILGNFKKIKLNVFLEIGFPNRSFAGYDPKSYSEHSMGSNIGLRKYGFIGIKELLFGIEYTRLVQGIYYNILPTPNWYDNKKFNYSSYNGRRWAAHSGSDSDDFLVYIGYLNKKISLICGLNYERHGVTYHFPPEVKFESRITVSYKHNDTKFYLNFENEYFEHYGFVDSNINVWDETFEFGSIQRTKTLMFSIEHIFSFN
mgnify:CR=1 FL=1